jgi:uncharacterized membrane protein YhdT
MTINKQCLVKSLKTDYKYIGTIFIGLLILGSVVYAALWCAITYQNQVRDFLITLAQPFTAVNIFILTEILVIGICVAIIIFDIPTSENDKQMLKLPNTTLKMVVLITVFMVIVWLGYNFVSAAISAPSPTIVPTYAQTTHVYPPPYPDVLPILAVMLIVNTFVVCPVSVAIARCKE